MAIDVTDKKVLKKLLRQGLYDAMNEIGRATAEKMKEEIDKEVYADEPKYYQRTGELRDAVTSTINISQNQEIAQQVFVDPKKMSVSQQTMKINRTNKNGKSVQTTITYGVHADNKGNDERENVVKYVFEGTDPSTPYAYTRNGNKGGLHHYPGHEPTDVMGNISNWLITSEIPSVMNDTFPLVGHGKVNIYKKSSK